MSSPFPRSRVQQLVYHGTREDFQRLITRRSAQGIIWFASDRAGVEAGAHGNTTGFVLELWVDLRNPAGWDEYQRKGLGELRRDGHDGALLPDGAGFTGFVFTDRQVRIRGRHDVRGAARRVIESYS